METSKRAQVLSLIAAAGFVVLAMVNGYRKIGLPPVIIVGGSGLIALVLWRKTYLKRPLDPAIILPVFLLTVAALEVHMIEEYFTALGLYQRVPLAGFIAWFIFIGPGVAEFTHFIFPVLRPAIRPELAGTISQTVSNGRFVADMPNYWVKTTGVYYFPGMYTAILPMIPGIYAIRKMIRASRPALSQEPRHHLPIN
jgi:hypothetical protein